MSDQLLMDLPGEPIASPSQTGSCELRLIPDSEAKHEDKTGPDMAEQDHSEFDWSNPSDIVIHEQPATAIYFNPAGRLVIRQKAELYCEEDTFVFIAPNNIEAFIDQLTALFGNPSAGGPREPSAGTR